MKVILSILLLGGLTFSTCNSKASELPKSKKLEEISKLIQVKLSNNKELLDEANAQKVLVEVKVNEKGLNVTQIIGSNEKLKTTVTELINNTVLDDLSAIEGEVLRYKFMFK